MIEIFVRSFSPYMDVETCREMSQHSYCAPGASQGLVNGVLSKFKGRVLPQEDSTVLERLLQAAGGKEESVRVYDVSRMTDNLKALRHGIRRTPVALINGEKYQGLKEILRVLSTLKQASAAQTSPTDLSAHG